MTAPKKTPHDFGFKTGDSHIVVSGPKRKAKAFDHTGKLLWEVPVLARGRFRIPKNSGNTPPGLYKIGAIYRDYESNPNPNQNPIRMSYGWYSFDLEELENQEARYGRAGIMAHGGGTNNGWPMAWNPKQPLLRTRGCLRLHNQDLRDKVLPLTKKGTVYVSVYQ